MSEDVNYSEFLAAFGVTPETNPPADPPADPVIPTDPPKDPVDPPADLVDPPKDDPKDPPKDPPATPPSPASDKTSQAFAQMRTENKKQQGILKGIAEVLGVQDPKNPEALLLSLQDIVTKAQAQKQGVPTELLQRLQMLEQRDQEYTQNQARSAAYLGFQKVKDTFELSDSDLGAFADTLVSEGINPFEQVIDLVAEYKLRNFDRLLADAITKGAQQEAERAAKANSHSSVPGKRQGQGSTDAEKITSVNQLSDWFSKQK